MMILKIKAFNKTNYNKTIIRFNLKTICKCALLKPKTQRPKKP